MRLKLEIKEISPSEFQLLDDGLVASVHKSKFEATQEMRKLETEYGMASAAETLVEAAIESLTKQFNISSKAAVELLRYEMLLK